MSLGLKNNSLVPLQYLFSGSFLICLNDIILGGNWHSDKDLAWLLERHSISWNNPFASKTSIIHSTISLYTSPFSQNGQKYGKKMKKYENLGRCVLELDFFFDGITNVLMTFLHFEDQRPRSFRDSTHCDYICEWKPILF